MITRKPIVSLVRLGRAKYLPALRLQHYLVEQVKASRKKVTDDQKSKNNISTNDNCANYLLILEHDPVYTTGIRNRDQYSKEAEEANFASLGADFVHTDRGGLITFHGPGQMVAYPILNLENFMPLNTDRHNCIIYSQSKKANLVGMRWYVQTLEQSVIDLCRDTFGLVSHRSPHTGVWLGSEKEENERKICAMGVHSSQLVTSHGLALNCNTDLDWFNHIVPCGIKGKSVTSITKELFTDNKDQETTVEEVIPFYVNSFKRNFQCDVIERDNSEFLTFLANASRSNSTMN